MGRLAGKRESISRIKDCVEKHGHKLSAFSSHSQASKPEIAVKYLKQAARFAKEAGAPSSTPMKATNNRGRPWKRTSY
jgi:sugar phosphate isomerase/epimerase